ncbi:C40 family peptidase [Micromonospora sp. PLK6-60]|uniref:C40 family peptidase n=1 Tax=Micromonospora sp. PLK6-60 TaxID=2873383 RepID=UPI001CA63646|nr:C40 family peptidase [Micromonospora sp. PLK6-60]MBY8871674.1 C40 family peptidase [Micromonospora sp. PLK6-60]
MSTYDRPLFRPAETAFGTDPDKGPPRHSVRDCLAPVFRTFPYGGGPFETPAEQVHSSRNPNPEEWTMLKPHDDSAPTRTVPPSRPDPRHHTRGPGRRGILGLLLALTFIGGALVGLTGLAGATAGGGCSGSIAEKAVCQARAQKGDPYVWGGKGPRVFDCSGLTHYAYRRAGLDWRYRTAAGQYSYGVRTGRTVSTSELRPGDLLFFDWDGGEIDHVGIYAGNGRMLHASSGRGKVVETRLNGYYRSHLLRSAVRPAPGSAGSDDGAERKRTTEPTSKPTRSTEPDQIPVVVLPFTG